MDCNESNSSNGNMMRSRRSGKHRLLHAAAVAAAVGLFMSRCAVVDGFVAVDVRHSQRIQFDLQQEQPTTQTELLLRKNNDEWYGEYHDHDNKNNKILMDRIRQMRLTILEEEIKRPPNVELSPKELVHEVVMGLYHAYDPTPDAGFRLLLQASTKDWRSAILKSVGAHEDADIAVVASALGAALERPNNQYSILVGEAEEFRLDFASELNFEDGTCWLECRLRDQQEHDVLVITGWDLVQEDGVWLVDRVLWQDFRDDFRPGVGREEWMMLVD